MTKEEAIKELKIFSGTTRIRLSANFWEALNTVIKALEQETCEDAVSRSEIQQKINRLWNSNGDKNYCMETLKDFVTELQPVTPTHKKGKWEQYGNYWEDKFKCSECGKEQPKILCGERIIGHWSDYCPNCGAKMEVEE